MKLRIQIIYISLLLISCPDISAQSMRERIFNYLDNYKRADQYIKQSTLDSLKVDKTSQAINIYVSGGFMEQFFTDEVVNNIYNKVKTFVPDSLAGYKVQIITDKHLIEQLVPNAIRRGEKSKERQWKEEYKGTPWVKNISSPLSAPLGLEESHIALWQSHGIYWKQEKNTWIWQRPHLFCTTEDLFTQTFVIPYIIPMLENAGALVYTPRDRNWQNHEVIVDNDAPEKDGIYKENGRWHICDSAGFAHLKKTYYTYDRPFSDGTVRYAETTQSHHPYSSITWTPDIPEDGEYAVYVSYQTLKNSVDDATYTVVHNGMKTKYKVNQKMGGSTWVYLGTFPFVKGCSESNQVELTNHSDKDGVITADAVRFGSGYGNIARGNTNNDSIMFDKKTSNMPRWAEAALYYDQWAGMPDSVYNHFYNDNDYNNDLWARPETVNTLAGGSTYVPNRRGRNVPFELTMGFHSDAGFSRTGALTGSLSICTSDTGFYNGKTNAGIDRFSSYDLASLLLINLSTDMQKYKWQVRQIWNRNYCETRESQVPSIILEMMSHQSFDDMKFGYDPKFKFDFCRSVYKTVVKYIATQHNRNYVIQPLPIRNFAITINDEGHYANLTWKNVEDPLEPTAKPDKYIVYTRINNGDFDNGTLVNGTSYNANLEKGKLYSFRVVAMNNGGISFPSETLSAYLAHKNDGTILIVNAFDRLEGPEQRSTATEQGFDIDADPGVQYGKFAGFCGRQITFDKTYMGNETTNGTGYSGTELEGHIIMGNTFDYIILHGNGIKLQGNHSFCSCSEEALISQTIIPKKYKMIDVIYGVQKTFNKKTSTILDNYCNNGGRLLVSGANIFNGKGFTIKSLHAINGEEIKDKSIEGVNGSSLNFTIYREMNDKSYAVPKVTTLQAEKGAFAMLKYSNNLGAAIAYNGTVNKTVAVGFPIESIKEAGQRDLLMLAITNFLCNK